MKIGDKVRWTSQAGGHEKVKEGEIIRVIPPYGDVLNYMFEGSNSAYGGGYRRDQESYLVRVKGEGKRKATIYWPIVKKLQLIGEI